MMNSILIYSQPEQQGNNNEIYHGPTHQSYVFSMLFYSSTLKLLIYNVRAKSRQRGSKTLVKQK